jgi:hypothetical protein
MKYQEDIFEVKVNETWGQVYILHIPKISYGSTSCSLLAPPM